MAKVHARKQDELAALEGQLKRALADYQNLERHVLKEKETIGKFATQLFLTELLPIVDNITKAVETAPEHEQKSAWFTAVAMSMKQLQDLLQREGVVVLNPVNEVYNPNEQEVVDVIEGNTDNVIVAVLEKGYKLHDKVLKPAKVRVARKVSAQAPDSQENAGEHVKGDV